MRISCKKNYNGPTFFFSISFFLFCSEIMVRQGLRWDYILLEAVIWSPWTLEQQRNSRSKRRGKGWTNHMKRVESTWLNLFTSNKGKNHERSHVLHHRLEIKFCRDVRIVAYGCLSLRCLCNKMGQALIIILWKEARFHLASGRDVKQGISHISNTESGLKSRTRLE